MFVQFSLNTTFLPDFFLLDLSRTNPDWDWHSSAPARIIIRNHKPECLVYPGVEEDQGGEGKDAGGHQAEQVHVVHVK